MTLTQSFLTLVLFRIVTAAAGPAAVAHEALHASPSNAQIGQSNGALDIIRPETEAVQEHHGPPLSMMEEAVHKVLPPPLWNILFEELPELLFKSNGDSETRATPQLHLNWLEMLAPYYLPNLTKVSPECRRDVNAISAGVISQQPWAQKVVDSWGKFSDGLLAGNLQVMGLLDECLMTTVDSKDPDAHFRGQYCSFSVMMKPKSMSGQGRTLKKGDAEIEEEEGVEVMLPALHMANVKGILQTAYPINLIATCIPSTCTKEEYLESLEERLERRGLQLTMLECQTKDMPTLRYNAADIIMIITLTVMGILVLVGTVTDVWIFITKNEEAAKGPMRYFLVFSFYTNLFKIFHINVKENEEVISCLHGIRVLSMCWVVLAHAYAFSIMISANKGLLGQMVAEHLYLYQFVLNGYPSVDTFFFMSGLLVAYNLTKEFQRTSKFNVPLYYIHRFIRLAPPIMLLSGFFAVFPPLFVQGSTSPLLLEEGQMVDNCIKYWWRDSFFVTNVFIAEANGQSCIPVCWYTAVDFQLYVLTPFIFLPILYFRRPGALVLGVSILVSVIVPMSIIGGYQLPPTNVIDASPRDSLYNMKYVYTKPWCRASPYLVGVALGYFLRMVDKEKMRLKWWQAALGWVAALAIMTAVVLGLKDYNTLSGKPHEYVPAISILYGSLHHLAWGVAVAWMVFACHMGYGGPINSLLGHPFWQPVSRLTYTIFLIAFNAQFFVMYYMIQIPTYASDFNLVMEAAGMLVLSGCGAVLLSLLTESPVLGLEKLILRRGM